MNKELTPLEALEDLISFIGNGEIANTHALCEYVAKRKDIIETALKKSQKTIDKLSNEIKHLKATNRRNERKLKALEIIVKKEVNVFVLAHSDSKETYNDMVSEHWRELTQEEFDFLKEVLL